MPDTLNARPPVITLHRLLWLCAIPSIGLAALLIGDLLLHLPALIAADPFIAVRNVLWAMVTCPLTIATALFVARRVPSNPVVPALVLWGVTNATWTLRSDVDPVTQAVMSVFVLGIATPGALSFPLCFPTGRFSPSRAEGFYSAYFVLNLLMGVVFVLSHSTFDNMIVTVSRPHPFFVPALMPLAGVSQYWVEVVAIGSGLLIPLSILLRYRRAGWAERQQIKWLMWLSLITVPLVAVMPLYWAIRANQVPGVPWRLVTFPAYTYYQLVPAIALIVAVWRYRLWDIDVIIRRTVVYSLLTVTLLAVYFGGVIGLQQVFVALTGQRSEVAIVLSTLGIAALSVPLRNRIQKTIDRRFYRRKYNAQQVLESFARTARDETDPDRLAGRLLDVVDDSLQPTQASLWMQRTGREVRR